MKLLSKFDIQPNLYHIMSSFKWSMGMSMCIWVYPSIPSLELREITHVVAAKVMVYLSIII